MLQVNDTLSTKKCKTNKGSFSGLKDLSFSSILLSVMIIVITVLILVRPVRYAESVVKGLKLFFTSVLPGLLPCMFLAKLLTGLNVLNKLTKPLDKPMRKLFGINGNGFYAFLMSIISGYPLGAKITADLYAQGKISENEVTKTALISSTSGLEFVIGAVGGLMLRSPLLGLIIYLSNILSALIASLFINLFSRKKTDKQYFSKTNISSETKITNEPSASSPTKKGNLLASAATDTCSSLLVVGFYIAMFSLIIDLLTDTGIISILTTPLNWLAGSNPEFPELSQGIMSGIIEMTNGAKQLSLEPSPMSVSFISMLISFSGVSIIMQSLSFLSSTPLKKGTFILGKVIQAMFSFTLCFIALSVIM